MQKASLVLGTAVSRAVNTISLDVFKVFPSYFTPSLCSLWVIIQQEASAEFLFLSVHLFRSCHQAKLAVFKHAAGSRSN